MKKMIKIPLIILSALLSLVILFIIGYGIFFLQVDAVRFDYTVDRGGDNIFINLNESGSNDGEQAATIKEKFVFNVSDASPENLPKLTKEEELSKEFV